MIGPALVHQTKKTETYHSLASGIVGLCPSLMNLIAYGTDGEKAIGNAFSLQFHKAIHLLCCLHVKRDIQRKLHDLGIPEKYSKEYINEIFGYSNGSHFTEELVDCECDSEYEDQLNKCCHVWNEREKLARDTNVPVFYDWFKAYHSDLVKTKMLKPVRVQAGLGDPPTQYTTNDNESINSRVKDKVDYKASELHIFCQKFEELVDMQTRNIERAFTLSNGPYCVCTQICYRNQNAGPDSHCQQKSSLSRRFIMRKFDLSIAHCQCSQLPLSQRIHLHFLFALMKQVSLIVFIKLCGRRHVCFIIVS